jgi:hypothetical protein
MWAVRLFDLFKADLLGLIADYAVTPLIDDWIDIETGEMADEEVGVERRVFAEVDLLEKALTYRATLRTTAAKILRSLDFQNYPGVKGAKLTDREKDELLRIVYTSEWPDNKPLLVTRLLGYTSSLAVTPYEERLKAQLARASEESLAMAKGLQDGSVTPINRYTEPALDTVEDEQSRIIKSLQTNPLKYELFLIYVKAEMDKLQNVVDLLAPIFASADFVLDEERYAEFVAELIKLGYYKPVAIQQEEAEYSPEEDIQYAERMQKMANTKGKNWVN